MVSWREESWEWREEGLEPGREGWIGGRGVGSGFWRRGSSSLMRVVHGARQPTVERGMGAGTRPTGR